MRISDFGKLGLAGKARLFEDCDLIIGKGVVQVLRRKICVFGTFGMWGSGIKVCSIENVLQASLELSRLRAFGDLLGEDLRVLLPEHMIQISQKSPQGKS
jgi:hypothetical protein